MTCDTCSQPLTDESITLVKTLRKPSSLTYHFCSTQCLLSYAPKHWKFHPVTVQWLIGLWQQNLTAMEALMEHDKNT